MAACYGEPECATWWLRKNEDAHERHACVEAERRTSLDEVVVELAGEEHDALDARAGSDRVREHGLELRGRRQLGQ
jgi:hypothetical protein